MIERLDHDHVTDFLQRLTNRGEKRQCVLDALLLFDNCLIHPLRAFVPCSDHRLMQGRESSRDYVVRICQTPELVEILSREGGNDRGNILRCRAGSARLLSVGSQEQLGEQG